MPAQVTSNAKWQFNNLALKSSRGEGRNRPHRDSASAARDAITEHAS